jgi:hypothetical protein
MIVVVPVGLIVWKTPEGLVVAVDGEGLEAALVETDGAPAVVGLRAAPLKAGTLLFFGQLYPGPLKTLKCGCSRTVPRFPGSGKFRIPWLDSPGSAAGLGPVQHGAPSKLAMNI